MEISHRHRFMFVHVYRTGGQSVRQALEPYSYVPGPRVVRAVAFWRHDRLIHRLRGYHWGHITADELRDALPAEMFERYFKFAFVRNPWDWQVSTYQYIVQRTDHPFHDFYMSFRDFDAYLDWRINTAGPELQKEFLVGDEDDLLVDFVGRHEFLARDFATVCEKLGISAQLPRKNSSRHGDYREYYTSATRAMVGEAYRADLELFGYEFTPQPGLPPLVRQ